MNTPTKAGVSGKAVASPEVSDLLSVIADMEGCASAGFGQIEAIANTALLALKTPEAYTGTDTLAKLLIVIRDIAFQYAATVSGDAEESGADCTNVQEDERFAARNVAMARLESMAVKAALRAARKA